MPREVEFKLEIDRNDIEAVTRTAARIGAVAGTTMLQSVYFDTDDHRLHKAGLSLRVRHDGDRRIQTVKAEQGKNAGFYDRDEWECAIDGDTPVLGENSPVADVFGGKGSERVAPMSRNSSASHRPRPRMACWHQGPGSLAASARIQPGLRRSSPSSPSRNSPAEAATRSCVNPRILAFTPESDKAHSFSVVRVDAPVIHDLPTMASHRFRVSATA